MPCTYLVFARYPRAGSVKTRLAASFGENNTLRLYEAMLRDTLLSVAKRVRGKHAQMLVFVYPPHEVALFDDWLTTQELFDDDFRVYHVSVLPQTGENLGNQMLVAFQTAQILNLLPAIILGTDSPTLPQQIFQEAEEALTRTNTAVVGKAEDGGFYMMGIQEVHESLFFGAEYSTNSVFERTRTALQARFSSVHCLPEWYDVDDITSLQKLMHTIDSEFSSPALARSLHIAHGSSASTPHRVGL